MLFNILNFVKVQTLPRKLALRIVAGETLSTVPNGTKARGFFLLNGAKNKISSGQARPRAALYKRVVYLAKLGKDGVV